MRKYLIGAIAGAALMFGIQTGASGVLTGTKVAGEKTVNYNGKSIGQAAIINNTSYLPVRAVSNSLGLQIDLSGGAINLTEPATTTNSAETNDTSTTNDSEAAKIYEKLNEVNASINTINVRIEPFNRLISGLTENDPGYAAIKKSIDEFQAQLTDLQKQKADLESQLKEFTKP